MDRRWWCYDGLNGCNGNGYWNLGSRNGGKSGHDRSLLRGSRRNRGRGNRKRT